MPEAPTNHPSDFRAPLLFERALGPVVDLLGFEILVAEWLGDGRKTLRVYVDRASGEPGSEVSTGAGSGVSLDDCARLSRTLSNALDAAETATYPLPPESGLSLREDEFIRLRQLLAAPYTLEVSSPGVERPLAKLSHFRQFVGHRATVRTFEPLVPGTQQRSFHVELVDVECGDEEAPPSLSGEVLAKELDGGRELRIPVAAIRRAHLQFDPESALKATRPHQGAKGSKRPADPNPVTRARGTRESK